MEEREIKDERLLELFTNTQESYLTKLLKKFNNWKINPIYIRYTPEWMKEQERKYGK